MCYLFIHGLTVVQTCAQGRHAVFSNHQLEWLASDSAALMILTWWERKEYPLDKLKRRRDMGRDGLACSKWPEGCHFPQCSTSPGTLVLICLLWAKVSETHCGHHGLEEIWQIQKSDPVCFSLLGEECAAHWYCMSLAVKTLLDSLEGCQIH